MMPQAEHYQSEVATIPAGAACREVAEKMKREGVGSLVVLDEGRPAGVVTDRDLLCRVIGAGRDTGTTVARDIMSQPLVSVKPEEPLERVVDAMAAHGIRRVPIVQNDELAGIVSLDDLLVALSEELGDLAAGARRGFRTAQRGAAARRFIEGLEERLGEVGDELGRLSSETAKKLQQQLESLGERIRGRDD